MNNKKNNFSFVDNKITEELLGDLKKNNMLHTIKKQKYLSIQDIKNLGLIHTTDNLQFLISIYNDNTYNTEQKCEIVSSIGRQIDNDKIYEFIHNNVFKEQQCMDIIYQMYRTCLCKNNIEKFRLLGEKIYNYYNNEIIKKMKEYFDYEKQKCKCKKIKHNIVKPTLLYGDNCETLKKIQNEEVNLIFTSPPYYNAREYSIYKSYQDYLDKMFLTLKECNRVLENGRFIIINVSPVITKRPGRKFESIRYPIHYDFHNILTKAGFYFIDEIYWIKPETSVKNRNGGYQQTQMPLSYKPNCITESLMVYRKNAPFLLDDNIKRYNKNLSNKDDSFDTSNCWYITPKYSKTHPAVFPEELCEKVLKYYSFIGDIVLDPFAGSGTFGNVAIKMNRIPILCEQNRKYCDFIKNNLFYDEI